MNKNATTTTDMSFLTELKNEQNATIDMSFLTELKNEQKRYYRYVVPNGTNK